MDKREWELICHLFNVLAEMIANSNVYSARLVERMNDLKRIIDELEPPRSK